MRAGWLGLALLLQGFAAAPFEPRVGLYRYHPPATLAIRCASPFSARVGARSVSLNGPVEARAHGATVELRAAGHSLLAGPVISLQAAAPWTLTAPGTPPHRYAGRLALRVAGGALLPVLTLPLEAYVQAAAGDEMQADWPPAALTAQGLAARSYAVAERGRHAAEGYDFCDLTHCQLFHGLASQDARVAAAVALTRGRVLAVASRAIPAVWHSTCAGQLEDNDAVFGGAPAAYLRAHPDRDPRGRAWCAGSPHAAPWHASFGRAAVGRALAAEGVLGPHEALRGLWVADALPDGLPVAIRVEGDRARTLSGYALWMALGPHFGWGELAGPRYAITTRGETLSFSGTGLGHLVGMCQWGARGRARAGWGWEAIARAYYPGTSLERLSP